SGLVAMLGPIHHAETAFAVTAERAFLAGLGGGCSVPVAAHARWEDGKLSLRGRVSAPDGARQMDVHMTASATTEEQAFAAGMGLAQDALSQGAQALMEQRS
ncbi:MAG: hydroxymethylbilane synthase, partial [Anaerolineae bacterium]|nr:hydroxymethylbilane synthase [Anaerolineae bacterium]